MSVGRRHRHSVFKFVRSITDLPVDRDSPRRFNKGDLHASLRAWKKTVMSSPYLGTTMPASKRVPQELCDCVIDEFHDQRDILKTFSLVSKSWAAQSQKHIFSIVKFSRDDDIEAWRNAFPDPANTLAHHTRTLVIDNPKEFPEDLFSSFRNVTSLSLHVRPTEGSPISFTRLHGFAPYLKSLEMKFSFLRPSDILDLVYSFPRLDNLSLAGLSMTPEAEGSPSKPLNFSGSLGLIMLRGIGVMTDHLSSLPGGVHFRKLALTWNNDRDSSSAMALISACASTLENLHLRDYTWGKRLHLLLWVMVSHFTGRCKLTAFGRFVPCDQPPIHLV